MGHTALKSIRLDVAIENLVTSHTVVMEGLTWWPDLRDEAAESDCFLALVYRFDPPLNDEEERRHQFAWKLWELDAQDDVGTEYDCSIGGVGTRGGDREIHPAPPPTATTLILSAATPRVGATGELVQSHVVQRFAVDLRTGTVNSMG